MKTLKWIAAALLAAACGGEPEEYVVVQPTEADRTRAREILAADYTPMPDGFEFREFEAPGVGPLRWGEIAGEPGAPTLVYVPGFRGYIELYTEFLAYWAGRGYRTVIVDLPGQGGSVRREDDPQKPFTHDFDVYGKALADFLGHVAERSDTPITVIGSSFGGATLARAAVNHELPVAEIVLLVPAFDTPIPDTPQWLGKALVTLSSDLGKRDDYFPGMGPWSMTWYESPSDSGCNVPPERINLYEAYLVLHPELRMGGATYGYATGLWRSGAALQNTSASIPQPVTLITATEDRIVLNGRSIALCSQDGFGTCEHRPIETGHCIVYENEDDQQAFFDIVDEVVARSMR